jgi:hypothetical protein
MNFPRHLYLLKNIFSYISCIFEILFLKQSEYRSLFNLIYLLIYIHECILPTNVYLFFTNLFMVNVFLLVSLLTKNDEKLNNDLLVDS